MPAPVFTVHPRNVPPGYFAGPPPRPPPPPPPPVNPYITVPPFPAPWLKIPPPVGSLPDLTAGINFPIQIPPPKHLAPLAAWNPASVRPPPKLGLVEPQLIIAGPGLLQRPLSPTRRNFPSQLAIMATVASTMAGPMSPRQPNAQFANTKYQRTPVITSVANPTGFVAIPRPPIMTPTSVSNLAGNSNSTPDEMLSSFIFLKDGIHFPQPPSSTAAASRATCPTPVNVLTSLHHQQQLQQQFIGRQPATMIDLAADLLPHDFDVLAFLQVNLDIDYFHWIHYSVE